MTEGLNSSPASNANAAPVEYPTCLVPEPVTPPPITLALNAMLPTIDDYAGRRKTFLAWFDGRISWGTVKHWKVNRRKPPAWVRATVAEHLRRKAAELNHIAELLER